MTTKGHIFLAQNSDVDYVRQAYALALSIKKHNTQHNKTCLVTRDVVPEEYKHAFDYIVDIPWGDQAVNSVWKVENRWKLIYATPFDENIVYDTDMLLLNTNDHWWEFLSKKDLVFTSNVFDYRGNQIQDDYYRKTFTSNDLPNLYVGVFYFKKAQLAYEYFTWLQLITENWKDFYKDALPTSAQNFYSMDVSSALAVKFMDCQSEVLIPKTLSPSFIHMKPAIQGWKSKPPRWTSVVNSQLTAAGQLLVGGYLQHGVFHYVEDEFLTSTVIDTLRA